jgi:hypothetical protein
MDTIFEKSLREDTWAEHDPDHGDILLHWEVKSQTVEVENPTISFEIKARIHGETVLTGTYRPRKIGGKGEAGVKRLADVEGVFEMEYENGKVENGVITLHYRAMRETKIQIDKKFRVRDELETKKGTVKMKLGGIDDTLECEETAGSDLLVFRGKVNEETEGELAHSMTRKSDWA